MQGAFLLPSGGLAPVVLTRALPWTQPASPRSPWSDCMHFQSQVGVCQLRLGPPDNTLLQGARHLCHSGGHFGVAGQELETTEAMLLSPDYNSFLCSRRTLVPPMLLFSHLSVLVFSPFYQLLPDHKMAATAPAS